jgi:hypothetical protein
MMAFEERPEEPEQLVMFDNMSFRLVMEGLYASIKLNKEKPNRGMTKARAEELLRRQFPEAKQISWEDDYKDAN